MLLAGIKPAISSGKRIWLSIQDLFYFRVDPFSEGRQNNFNRLASPESVSIVQKTGSKMDLFIF